MILEKILHVGTTIEETNQKRLGTSQMLAVIQISHTHLQYSQILRAKLMSLRLPVWRILQKERFVRTKYIKTLSKVVVGLGLVRETKTTELYSKRLIGLREEAFITDDLHI